MSREHRRCRTIVLVLLPLVALSCTRGQDDPAPRPDPAPEPPIFRLCQTCQGTDCVIVLAGQKDCKVVSDSTGRSCTASGACLIGTFGAASMPFGDDLPKPDAEVLAARERINSLLADAVVPKLAPCWGDLQGRGAVTVEHEFVRSEQGDWQAYGLQVVHSTLPAGQDERVDACLRKAFDGAVMPSDPGDGEQQELLLIWSWAVPLE